MLLSSTAKQYRLAIGLKLIRVDACTSDSIVRNESGASAHNVSTANWPYLLEHFPVGS